LGIQSALTAVFRAFGLVHRGRLNHCSQFGFGIPLIRLRRLLGHNKSLGSKLLLPVIETGLRDAGFMAYGGHRLIVRRHQLSDHLFFEFCAVAGHCYTPSAPSNFQINRADIYCDRGGLSQASKPSVRALVGRQPYPTGATVAKGGNESQKGIAATPNMGEIRLHLLAWGRLEPNKRFRLSMLATLQKLLQLRDASRVPEFLDLAQQHRCWNPVRSGCFDAPEQIVLVGIQLRWPRLTRLVLLRIGLTSVSPDRVARAAWLLAHLSHTDATTRQYFDLHCLLLSQHCRWPKSHHHCPGGSDLLRRGGGADFFLDCLA